MIVESDITKLGKLLIYGLIVGVFAFQFSSIVSILGQNSNSAAVLISRSSDAGTAVRTAVKTRWYNDNGFVPYGPTYYRIIHSFSQFASTPKDGSATSDLERQEIKHHFVSMVVSLISLMGIAFLASTLFCGYLIGLLTSTMVITSLALSNATWTHFVFTTHPDLLFAFFVFAAFLATIKWAGQSEDVKLFFRSASLWGIAASTKLSFLLFSPAILAVHLFVNRGKAALPFFKYILAMLAAYFVIGIPQNFEIVKHLDFLKYQSTFSRSPTVESAGDWIRLFYSQSHQLLIGVIPLVLLLKDKRSEINLKSLSAAATFVSVSFLFLLSRNVISSNSHYTLPYIFPFLSLIIVPLTTINTNYIKKGLQIYFLCPIILFTFNHLIGLVPKNVLEELQSQETCLKETLFIKSQLEKSLQEGKKILVTPYVPVIKSGSPYRKSINYHWTHTFNSFAKIPPDILYLKKSFYSRFTTDSISDYVKNTLKDESETRRFFKLFHGTSEMTDLNGTKWTKDYSDECGYEIWKKEKT